MKKIVLFLMVISITLACKNPQTDTATVKMNEEQTEKSTSMADQTTSDWIVLFDGSNFDHWRGYGIEGMPSEWSIEEGAMAFTPGKEGGKNIITKATFENFELQLEWKIAEGGNSGIFWGVHESSDFKEAYETGPEIQVLDDERHPDAKAGTTHRAGALYDMISPIEGIVKPAGEWNSVVLEVNHSSNLGKVAMNGTEMFTFPVHGPDWDAMVANSKFASWKGFGKYPEGHIGLQDHGDKVWYRTIKIKKLDE